MSEETGQSPESTPVAQNAMAMPSAGEMLRQARESYGIHVAELALALKVSVKKIEALEADRLDLLPDAVFVRALASGVCRALKIDPAPILDRLPQTAVPRLELDGAGLNTPFQAPGDVSGVSIWNQLSRPVVLVALAFLAGALVLIFFPSMDHVLSSTTPSSAEVAVPAPSVPVVTAPVETALPKPAMLPEPVKTVAPTAAVKAPVAKPAVVAAPASAPVAATVAPKPAPVPVQAAAVPAATGASAPLVSPVQGKATSSGIIVFKTQGPSWIEVTDGDGAVQIRRTIQEGEVVGVSGPLPLSVVIGRADITEVTVRGKPYALGAITRENVARFEVKQ